MGFWSNMGKKLEKHWDAREAYWNEQARIEAEKQAKRESTAKTLGIISIVFGTLGILLICVVGVGFFPGLIAMIISGISFIVYASSDNRTAIVGMVEGVISVVLSILVFILFMLLSSSK